MINPTSHVISEFAPASMRAADRVRRSLSALTAASGSWTTAPPGDRADRPVHARDRRVQQRPNPGAALGRLAVGPDGNIWFGDKGATPAIGKIDPTTHAITQFSVGLNAGSLPGGMGTGSDGNVWFTDQGVPTRRSGGSASMPRPRRSPRRLWPGRAE